jgi:uncharacterized protein YkwD
LAIVIVFWAVLGWLFFRAWKLGKFNRVPAPIVRSLPQPTEIPPETNESIRTKVFALVNQEREKAGLVDLKESPLLNKSASDKAQDMIAKNYWSHVSPSGEQPWQIIGQDGYSYRYAAENLARDYLDAESAVQAWMDSPEHRNNMLSAKYTETGIAVVDGIMDGRQTKLIVQHFGTPYIANTTPSRTGAIVSYREWCTGKNIQVYENEIIVKKSSDGKTYGMTTTDWTCYENSLKTTNPLNR